MSYPVLNRFREKEHNGTIYNVGDSYPAKGFKVDAKRVSFLQKTHSEYGVCFLGDKEATAINKKSDAK